MAVLDALAGLVILLLGAFYLSSTLFSAAQDIEKDMSSVENLENAESKLGGRLQLDCTVLIIGSGFAGSFAAYQLAPIFKDKLCLVERLIRDGGRIYDISEYPNGPVYGVGALRITELQTTMRDLAVELGINLQVAEDDVEVLKVRGRHFFRGISQNQSDTSKMCKELFPNMQCSKDDAIPTDQLMFDTLKRIHKNSPYSIFAHPDFPTFLLSLFDDEGLAFLRECIRYNSPFTSISTHGVLDFFENELRGMGLDPLRSYPEGGMSEYIKRMIGRATADGMRIYRGQPVETISTAPNDTFLVNTPIYSIRADRVLCSIDPLGFAKVTGDVAENIKASLEFRGIAPKPLAIVTAWWHERWWEKSVLHAANNLSRVVSHENCFNTMDIPTFPYGRNQNVTRTVYDDGACVNTWRTLISDQDTYRLASEVVASLQSFFTDIVVPRPRKLHGFVHENAWHFQHPRSTIRNHEVFQWSLHPIPQDNFALIGEAYNLNFAAWCDGALKSSMTALTDFYNFTYPCKHDHGSPAICGKAKRSNRKNSGGTERFNLHSALP